MLAPQIVEVIFGHRHLHVKVEDVRIRVDAERKKYAYYEGIQAVNADRLARVFLGPADPDDWNLSYLLEAHTRRR